MLVLSSLDWVSINVFMFKPVFFLRMMWHVMHWGLVVGKHDFKARQVFFGNIKQHLFSWHTKDAYKFLLNCCQADLLMDDVFSCWRNHNMFSSQAEKLEWCWLLWGFSTSTTKLWQGGSACIYCVHYTYTSVWSIFPGLKSHVITYFYRSWWHCSNILPINSTARQNQYPHPGIPNTWQWLKQWL